MIQASSGENWKNTSTSKAVISRGRCRRPKNVACQLSMAPSLKAARYTPANRDQQVIESESRIDIDLCNYRQKLPYVIARKTRGPRLRAHAWHHRVQRPRGCSCRDLGSGNRATAG